MILASHRFVQEHEPAPARKCGTCRHFEAAGPLHSQGRCGHPARSGLSDVVLVRRAELACRDRDDNDLWSPRTPALDAALERAFTPSRQCGWPWFPIVIRERVGGIH